MAATTITNNYPSAGSIAWSGFNISYGGISYAIPAGSSAAKYVWWKYNTGAASGTGAPQLLQSDTLPTLSGDDILLFLNKGGIGMLVPTTTIIDGGLVVPESIFAPAIAADQIGTKHLAAGAVEAENIAAGAVTTNSLSVGSVSDNMVANGSFEDFANGALEGWEVSASTGGTITPVTGVSSSGAVSVQFGATTTAANLKLKQAATKYLPVSNASMRSWYFSVRMGASVAITRGAYLRVLWFDANRAPLTGASAFTDIVTNAPLTTVFSVLEGQAAPPAAARYAAVEVSLQSPNVATAKMYVDEVVAYQVLVSARIGDGAITTPKITVDEAFANKVFAGVLEGAIVQTNAAANRGVKITDAGLFAFNNAGAETLRLDGANSILTGATIRTAASGARVQISENGLEGWDAGNTQYLKADADGLSMTGSISTKGKTNEATPRDIAVRLTTVLRDRITGGNYSSPALVFDDGVTAEGLTRAPGLYSPDGRSLVITGRDGISGNGTFELSHDVARLDSVKLQLGVRGLWPTKEVEVRGEAITVGGPDILGIAPNVKLEGNVTVNGSPLGIQHAEFTATFSQPSNTTITKVSAMFARDSAQEKNGGFASPSGTGSITLQPGVYSIHYRADAGSPMGDTARLGLANASQTAEYTASPIKTGEWDGVLQHPNLYLPQTSTVVFTIRQNSGSPRTCNVRVIIEKIK